jgi:hypothetical protein
VLSPVVLELRGHLCQQLLLPASHVLVSEDAICRCERARHFKPSRCLAPVLAWSPRYQKLLCCVSPLDGKMRSSHTHFIKYLPLKKRG